MHGLPYSRRRFLRQLLGAGTVAATGLDPLLAQAPPVAPAAPQPFRFAFVTDIHLMKDNAHRSADGMAACLAAVEKLSPRPDFILMGGDLVHASRELTIRDAERQLNLFLKIWNNSTALPTHWVFGNHDLVGTSNPAVSPDDPNYSKGLFKRRLHLPQLYYAVEHKGWRFIILDDIAPQPGQTYIGEMFPEQLAYTQADLAAHAGMPTIVCTHIPVLSNVPLGIALYKTIHPHVNLPTSLVCTNSGELTSLFPGHNIRGVLCGHMHFYEHLEVGGIPYVNSGAVCGSYWNGPLMGCPEGFGVVDLAADGTMKFDYRAYGWKAS